MSWQSIVIPLGFFAVVTLAALIIDALVPTPAPVRYGVPPSAVLAMSQLTWRVIRLNAIFAAYERTGDPAIFPRGDGWFWGSGLRRVRDESART